MTDAPTIERPRAADLTRGDLYVFDGECLLCSRFVRFLVRHDQGRFSLVTAQSPTGRAIYRAHGLSPDAMETALLIVGGPQVVPFHHLPNLSVFTESLVVLGWPWRAAAILRLLPQRLSDWLYRQIADNRRVFNRGTCPAPTPAVRARLVE